MSQVYGSPVAPIQLPSTPVQSQNGREQALGFVNFMIPRNDGSMMKLCAAALRASKADLKQLHDGLEDGSITIDQLKEALVLDFRKNTGNSSGLAIG